ncbi:MAG: 50S ribosomal protein L6 [Bacilli bacterium]|nr:50S ribosomal protein L6 [Bacilli bacterium]
MSRIGNRHLAIPEGVTVEVNGNVVTVKGSKGELNLTTSDLVTVEVKDGAVVVTRKNETIPARQIHGTTNANIRNMILGVSEGYSKSLEIVGVGYRFNLKGNKLVINAGYSHPVEVEIPSDLKLSVEGNNSVTISGISKQKVGEFAANIRKVRKPEPYKGKGIRYAGEHIRRKEGKKAK